MSSQLRPTPIPYQNQQIQQADIIIQPIAYTYDTQNVQKPRNSNQQLSDIQTQKQGQTEAIKQQGKQTLQKIKEHVSKYDDQHMEMTKNIKGQVGYGENGSKKDLYKLQDNGHLQHTLNIKEYKEVSENQNVNNNQTTFAPWKALLQYQKKSQKQKQKLGKQKDDKLQYESTGQAEMEVKAKSQREVLKKIKNKKNKSKSSQRPQKQIQSLPNRKMIDTLPSNILQLQDSDHQKAPLAQPQPQKPLRNTYRRKNFKFEQKVTKIRQIKANPSSSPLATSNKSINLKGQIIFIWYKQNINQKWAKTQMTCIQVWDTTGAMIVIIPNRYLTKRKISLQIGNYVVIRSVEIREKYPRTLCLLITQKSIIQPIPRTQISPCLLFQPQSLALTLPQLTTQPISHITNIICLILSKSPQQYIHNNAKNTQLTLCKLQVYDPISNKKITIKLWQQKCKIKFYCNSVVYLLRGVQVREFKGEREYHATKEFGYRGVWYSQIGRYLGCVRNQRRKVLQDYDVDGISKMNIKDSLMCLQYQRKINKINKHTSPNSQPLTFSPSPSPTPCSPINLNFSITLIKFLSLQLTPLFPLFSTFCKTCSYPTQLTHSTNRSLCPQCKSTQYYSQYSIKCQFYDGDEIYCGEIMENAGRKMFAVGKQAVDVEFLGNMNRDFRCMIAEDAIGDVVRAVVASGRQKVGQEWINAYFIVDLLPFQDQQTQETINQTIINTQADNIPNSTKT